VVISSNDFNENQTSGLIVLPLISGLKVELTKFKNVPPTWVRVIFQGEAAFGLVEQIRYIDRSRCGVQIGQLVEYDLKQVEDKLRELLLRNVWCRE
jgi:mRNA-degrading endonuclease toxin of MazEF toxin-antitoxin module